MQVMVLYMITLSSVLQSQETRHEEAPLYNLTVGHLFSTLLNFIVAIRGVLVSTHQLKLSRLSRDPHRTVSRGACFGGCSITGDLAHGKGREVGSIRELWLTSP